MNLKLRMTGAQHDELRKHLLRSDGCEAVAVVLCGRHRGSSVHVLTVQEVHTIAEEDYIVREPNRLEYHTRSIVPLVDRARIEGLALGVFHSHPQGVPVFSRVDDVWDRKLFPPYYGWFDEVEPLVSGVMDSEGELAVRAVMPDGEFVPAISVMVAGDEIKIWGRDSVGEPLPDFTQRHTMVLGEDTSRLLRSLRVGVVGCSGTGTPVVEMLARLGVEGLVLVDPGRNSDVNRNRSVGLKASELGELKVVSTRRRIESYGLGTEVLDIAQKVKTREAVLALAGCDVLFGCMDRFDGRDTLNRLATHYLLPYFDIGVGIRCWPGGRRIEGIEACVHYLKPGGSSLMSRGVYTPEDLAAEELLDNNPDEYQRRLAEGYIVGVDEQAPTVVPVNFLAASRAVMACLARLHPGLMTDPCSESAWILDDLRHQDVVLRAEPGAPCPVMGEFVGKADRDPLLGIPDLEVPEDRPPGSAM